MADEAEFAGRVFDAFGQDRFTLAQYFASIERSNYQRMPLPGQNQQMCKTLERYAQVRALLPAPGPRGGTGWKLNPAALPGNPPTASGAGCEGGEQAAGARGPRARIRQMNERAAELRRALADRLRKAGLVDPVVEECLGTVDAIVAATR